MGEFVDYWEFREVFRTLVDELYPEHMLYIKQLKNLLPKEGKNVLRGVVIRQEAWVVLDQHYGDSGHNCLQTETPEVGWSLQP